MLFAFRVISSAAFAETGTAAARSSARTSARRKGPLSTFRTLGRSARTDKILRTYLSGGRVLPVSLRSVAVTTDDIDALVGPATPHFAYQIRARVRELIQGLPDGDPVRAYGEEQMAMLDRLGHASST